MIKITNEKILEKKIIRNKHETITIYKDINHTS